MPAFSTRNSTAPPLAALTAPGDVHGDRADLRVRHQAARAEHLTETADERHHVRRGDAAVEVDLAAVDALDQVLGADDVGAGGPGLVGLGAAGEHGHAHRPAGAVRQVARRRGPSGRRGADRRRGSSRPRSVSSNFALARSLTSFTASSMRIELGAVDALAGGADALAFFAMPSCPPYATSRPIERAEPSIMAMAASTRVAVEIDHLLLGDLADLVAGHACRRCRPCRGSCEPFSIFAAFLRK